MLIAVSHRERDYDIEDNGPGKARYALAPYEKGGGKDYDIAAEILADVEILEFQREHPETRHHGQRYEQDGDDYERVTRKTVLRHPVGEADPEYCVGGDGKAGKRCGLAASMLNFARRSAPHTGMSRAANGTHEAVDSAPIVFSISMPGATPKLTRSESESSSLPIGEYAWSRRAEKPSQKSNIAASAMKI